MPKEPASTTLNELPISLLAAAGLTIGAVVVALIVVPGLAVAQDGANGTATPTATPENEAQNASDLPDQELYELGDIVVRSVEWEGQTVRVGVEAERHADVAITDAGAIQSLGSDDSVDVPFEVYELTAGETTTLVFETSGADPVVTIQSGGDMRAESGSRGAAIIAAGASVSLVRIGTLSGIIGSLVALAFVLGSLKRRHSNTYRELTADERIRVDRGRVEGVVGSARSLLRRRKWTAATIACVGGWTAAALFGLVSGPAALWADATDAQRVLALGIAVAALIALLPAYVLVSRWWSPTREFVVDIDARDVIDGAIGAEGGLQAIDVDVEGAEGPEDVADALEEQDITVASIYSAAPERVAEMRVDGEPADCQLPGGRGHIVQSFDPESNTAEGTWPGLADDFELARSRSKIDANREVLEDFALVGRRIIGALPAIRAGADTSAVAAVDREFARASSIDSGPVDSVLDSAVEGTRFESHYSRGERAEEGDADTSESADEADDGEVTNSEDQDDE